MEPKTIKEGGRNYGTAQRAGGITFATVVLKRGVSTDRGMWQIFNAVASGQFAPRLQVTITLLDGSHASHHGVATRPCDAGEIQICGPERPRHGGRHRGIALRSRRAFRGLKRIRDESAQLQLRHRLPTVVKATLTAMPNGTPIPVHFNPASLVYTVENSTRSRGRSETAAVCGAVHRQADDGPAVRHHRLPVRTCGKSPAGRAVHAVVGRRRTRAATAAGRTRRRPRC